MNQYESGEWVRFKSAHQNRVCTADLPSHAIAKNFRQELILSIKCRKFLQCCMWSTKTITEGGTRETRSRNWSTIRNSRPWRGGNEGRRRSVNADRKRLGDDVVVMQPLGAGLLPPLIVHLQWRPAGILYVAQECYPHTYETDICSTCAYASEWARTVRFWAFSSYEIWKWYFI